jgi:tetratricopeptide (TPR) repeat protein
MRLLPTIALVMLAATLSAAAQGQREQDFERLFVRGLDLQRAGDVIGAIDNYKAALEILPDRVDALSNLGAAYVQLGQYDKAIAQYQAALKADPLNTAVRLNLGLAFYKSAQLDEAIPQLRRVLAADPESRSGHLVLADCYLQTGREKEVVALLQPREQMFGNDLAFAYVLGTALMRLERADEGQRYVDRIFGAGESAEGHLLTGIAYLNGKEYRGAKSELEKALKLNPRLPTVHSLYGRSLVGLGDQEGAERAFRRELELNVNDFEANLNLGQMRRAAQKFDDASIYLERALAVRPNDLAARKLLGDLRLQSGRTEEAMQIFEALVKDAPEFIAAHVQLATAYNRLKRPADAQRHREIVDRLNAAVQAKQGK